MQKGSRQILLMQFEKVALKFGATESTDAKKVYPVQIPGNKWATAFKNKNNFTHKILWKLFNYPIPCFSKMQILTNTAHPWCLFCELTKRSSIHERNLTSSFRSSSILSLVSSMALGVGAKTEKLLSSNWEIVTPVRTDKQAQNTLNNNFYNNLYLEFKETTVHGNWEGMPTNVWPNIHYQFCPGFY